MSSKRFEVYMRRISKLNDKRPEPEQNPLPGHGSWILPCSGYCAPPVVGIKRWVGYSKIPTCSLLSTNTGAVTTVQPNQATYLRSRPTAYQQHTVSAIRPHHLVTTIRKTTRIRLQNPLGRSGLMINVRLVYCTGLRASDS